MKICEQCKTVLNDIASYCPRCGGAKFTPFTTITCTYCKNQVAQGTIVCPHCHRILPVLSSQPEGFLDVESQSHESRLKIVNVDIPSPQEFNKNQEVPKAEYVPNGFDYQPVENQKPNPNQIYRQESHDKADKNTYIYNQIYTQTQPTSTFDGAPQIESLNEKSKKTQAPSTPAVKKEKVREKKSYTREISNGFIAKNVIIFWLLVAVAIAIPLMNIIEWSDYEMRGIELMASIMPAPIQNHFFSYFNKIIENTYLVGYDKLMLVATPYICAGGFVSTVLGAICMLFSLKRRGALRALSFVFILLALLFFGAILGINIFLFNQYVAGKVLFGAVPCLFIALLLFINKKKKI